jgi:hypothetical protein
VKSLDRKLADLRGDPRAADAFILADAKLTERMVDQ